MLSCGFCCIIALMIFMENNLPKRKHPRLGHYDYSTVGAYYITICTQNRRCLLSRIVGRGLAPAEIQYTAYGQIAREQLLLLEQRYPSLKIDQYVIMPNHIHAILLLEETAGASPRPTISVLGKQSVRLSTGCNNPGRCPNPQNTKTGRSNRSASCFMLFLR